VYASIVAGSVRAFSLDELKETTYAVIYAYFVLSSLADGWPNDFRQAKAGSTRQGPRAEPEPQ
jgi:hypothetical protein